MINWIDFKSWFESWSQALFHSCYSVCHRAKQRSNYSASKTGRGIVFSPVSIFRVKTGLTVETTPPKKKNLLDAGGWGGEEGSKPRWNQDERSLCQSLLPSRFLGQIWILQLLFVVFALDSRQESKRKSLSFSCEREREVFLSGLEVYKRSSNASLISSLLSHLWLTWWDNSTLLYF